MDENTAYAFVNRDEPIPVIEFDLADDLDHDIFDEPAERKRDRLRRQASNMKENVRKVQGKVSETGTSMQDRLLEKYVLQRSLHDDHANKTGYSNKSFPPKTPPQTATSMHQAPLLKGPPSVSPPCLPTSAASTPA
jgi:hypothetical protein